MKRKWLMPVLIGSVLFSTCRKDNSTATTNISPAVTADDKMKDSVLAFSRDIYLWYDQIPSGFNARNYADPDTIMRAIRKYSNEPGFSLPVDRWSFAYKKTDWDNLSSGISQDFGLSVFFMAQNDLRVKYVERDSPAGKAGIKRGWRITAISGNTNITPSNSDFIIKQVFESTSTAFTFQKPDGSSSGITLDATTYQEHPVFLDTVYAAASKKIGYLVFNSFLGDTNEIYNEFQRLFNRFNVENVNEVIVDLRYNGGGYVNVQEKLADYLVNSAADGNVMMNQQFNKNNQQLSNTTNFHKSGSLNLDRIFFVVSNNTASASELLINNLKPYMNVKLVGQTNTYGKPVGFFPIPVSDWYIFPVSFRSTNKNGDGNYFEGIAVDKQVPDGLDKDWGDRNEAGLASVLQYIGTGTFSINPELLGSKAKIADMEDSQVATGNNKLDRKSFKGAVDIRGFKN